MFDTIKKLFWSSTRRDTHNMLIALDLRIVQMLVGEFEKSAEDSNHFDNWTPEEKKDYHLKVGEQLANVMNDLKSMDRHLYDILKWRYKDTLLECDKLIDARSTGMEGS